MTAGAGASAVHQVLGDIERLGTFVDKLPEILGLAESFILATTGEIAAIEKIRQSVFMQHAMDTHMAIFDPEVDAVITGTAAVKLAATGTLKNTKVFFQQGFFEITRLDVQGFKKLELDLGGQA